MHSLFLNNKLAGQDAEQLQNEIADCGVTGFKRKRTSGQNKSSSKAARNMLRKCLKHSQWPQIYVAEIRTFHPKMQIEILQEMAFILPHELLFALGDFNSVDTLTTLDGAATSVKNHCQAAAELLQSPVAAMGLWCDGTPFNWERTKSLELLLINFPGLSESNKTWRFPVAAVPHEHVSKRATFEDIFQIMAWSFQQCLLGTMPNMRHDGTQFNSTDSWRKKRAGKLLPCKAILAEVRADWKCQSEIFHLPHWNKNDGLRCKCSATPISFKDFSSLASWRHERIDHWKFLERQLKQKRVISSIYHCPFFTTDCFKIDWLHTMDLGVSCDTIGNACWYLLGKFPGNRASQVAALFLKIKDFYARNGTQDKIGNLTEKMIRNSATQSPKLKTRAAETRALVPWACEICEDLLDPADNFEAGIRFVMRYLLESYKCLSRASFEPRHFQDMCFKFLMQYHALEIIAPEYTWFLKPKFHSMAELALSTDNPSMNWVYRGEECGGTLARLGRSRGSVQTPWSVSSKVLQKFAAEFAVPIFE